MRGIVALLGVAALSPCLVPDLAAWQVAEPRAGATPGCGRSPVSTPASSPLAEVPFTLYQNAVIVPALVNDRDTVHLLLDTGWGPLALVSAAAERLGVPVDAPGADGLGRARIASLSIGDATRTEPFVEVFPTDALAPLIGPHDGVLSTAFFRDFVLQIDYPARVVRFFTRSPAASAPSARDDCTTVPMTFAPEAGALPFTDSVFVDGRPARGLFDTGGAAAFLATRRLIDRAGLRPIPDARAGIGMLSGDSVVRQPVQFARVARIAVGAFRVDSPRVILAPPSLEGNGWGHDLIIGYGFLRNYVVTFDFPDRRVTLERPPGPRSSQPRHPVCDTVLAMWRATGRADVRLADTSAPVLSESLPPRGCIVLATAPQGLDAAQWAGLYWATGDARGWTELLPYSADGPDGGSRTLQRGEIRCQIDFSQDGGDDSDSTYVPSPAIGETTFCWRTRARSGTDGGP